MSDSISDSFYVGWSGAFFIISRVDDVYSPLVGGSCVFFLGSCFPSFVWGGGADFRSRAEKMHARLLALRHHL